MVEWTINRRDGLSTTARATFDGYYAHCLHGDRDGWLARNEQSFTEIYDLLGGQQGGGEPLDVLDIGCGCGSEALAFASFGARVHAIDVSESRLQTARERAATLETPAPRFERCGAFSVAGAYDLIWMNHAYHHVEPRADFAAQLARLLRPGGHLVIAEPNGSNPLVQYAMFRIRGFKTIAEAVDETGATIPYGNERITTRGALVRTLTAVGLETVSTRFFRVFPNAARFQELEKRLARWPLPQPAWTHMVIVFRRPAAGA